MNVTSRKEARNEHSIDEMSCSDPEHPISNVEIILLLDKLPSEINHNLCNSRRFAIQAWFVAGERSDWKSAVKSVESQEIKVSLEIVQYLKLVQKFQEYKEFFLQENWGITHRQKEISLNILPKSFL